MATTSTTRDYAAEYFTAATEDRTPGKTLTERLTAQDRMESIWYAADRAGIALDVYGIDEAARLALYPVQA